MLAWMGASDDTVPLGAGDAQRLRDAHAARDGVTLLAYTRDGVHAIHLAEGSRVVVGREAPSNVLIDDSSLSRQHARFELASDVVSVRDLGSTNGTTKDGEAVTSAPLVPGDEIHLGNILVSWPKADDANTEVSGLVGEDETRVLLERELVRARHFDRSLGFVFVRARDGADHHISGWLERVRAQLRPIDTVAVYSDDALQVVLPEAGWNETRALAGRLLQDGELSFLRLGLAVFPDVATSPDKLASRARAAAQRTDTERRAAEAEPSGAGEVLTPLPGDGAVVASPAMRELFETVERVAQGDIPVLVHGETGAGKEIVARALHERGRRSDKPLVCLNCGAISPQLLQSALFGHEKGSFTGASERRAGVFEAADGGTLFLDEIGELNAEAQAALLRVLETGTLSRVGSTKTIDVDVRVVAATHRDLEERARGGDFRDDLLYRLNAVTLDVPPLRDRKEDVEALARRFTAAAAERNGRDIAGLSPEVVTVLRRYGWPGNVRELKNAVERAVIVARGETIAVEDLPPRVRKDAQQAPFKDTGAVDLAAADDEDVEFKKRVQEFEARLILDALRKTEGNQTQAAKHLKMPLRTLINKMNAYGIKRGEFDRDE
jgi:DNA-binding NtrC family response regulator